MKPLFAQYEEHGWRLVDIPHGQKGPLAKGWNTGNVQFYGVANAGVLHALSGTCTLDIDQYIEAREWLKTRGIDLDALTIDPTAVHSFSGQPDRDKLWFRLSKPLPSLKLAPYVITDLETKKPKTYHAFELRCAAKDGMSVQDVVPGSVHPNGRTIEWRYGDDLIGDWRALPELPAELLALWESELAENTPVISAQVAEKPPTPRGAEAAELLKLLENFDPDSTYDEWLKIGMALHHETTGSSEGFQVWVSWSAQGTKFKGSEDCATHWKSFKTGGANPVTIRSLTKVLPTVASPDEFEAEPVGQGEDTRPDVVVRNILESRLVHVIDQEKYFDLQTGVWLSDRAIRHTFYPKMPEFITQGANGKEKVTRSDPVKFLMQSETKKQVNAVGVHPGKGRFYTEDGRDFVNTYKPIEVEPLQPRPHELEAFKFLWSRMVERSFSDWLLKFYAHAVQKPGIKITAAPILWSDAQGTGKNTLARAIPERLFGVRWVRSMSGDVLSSSFNGVLGETWWLYLDELRAAAPSKADRHHLTNKLKSWITDPYITVHRKGMEGYDIPNHIQITATSNFDDALALDDNDRRWAVGELGLPMTAREGIDLYAFLDGPRAAGVLRFIFMNANISGFNPTAQAPGGRAKKAMVASGINTWESVLVERMTALDTPFDRDLFTVKDVLDQRLFPGQQPNAMQLGKILAKSPFNCRVLPNFSRTRIIAWRNIDEWSKSAHGVRAAYLDGGPRPAGEWSDEVPDAISERSAGAAFAMASAPSVSSGSDVSDLF